MASALEITIAILILALIGASGVAWIYFVLLHERWRRMIRALLSISPPKATELTVRFFSTNDPDDVESGARVARAAARRALVQAAVVSLGAVLATGLLLALLAMLD